MKKSYLLFVPISLLLGAVLSCQKEIVKNFEKPTDVVNPNPPAPPTEYAYGLRDLGDAIGLKLGVAFTQSEYFQNDSVPVIIARDFASVTFGNEMKHSSIVNASGKLKFDDADVMMEYAADCDVDVFGHTLGWHQQQNVSYLTRLINDAAADNSSSLLQNNWNFEEAKLDPFTVSGLELVTEIDEVFVGKNAAKTSKDATFTTPSVTVEAGMGYTLSFWVKAAAEGGNITIAASDGQTLTAESVPMEWNQCLATFKADEAGELAFTLTFDGEYYIDNVRVTAVELAEEEVGGGNQNFLNPYSVVEDGSFEETYTAGALFGQNGWSGNGGDYATVVAGEAHSGNNAVVLDNSTDFASNGWDIQAISPAYEIDDTKTYRIAWYSKADAEADLQIDIRVDSGTQYKSSAYGNYPATDTDWTYCCYDFTPAEGDTEIQIAFYGGTAVARYVIDDLQIFPVETPAAAARGYGKYYAQSFTRPMDVPVMLAAAGAETGVKFTDKTNSEVAVDRLQHAYKTWIFGMVEHFDVYAWDVVNETFTESGNFRTSNNTTSDDNNIFLWGDYFGAKEWVDMAFAYTQAALAKYGKTAALYINDYNLEVSPEKIDALCEYAKNNPDVTGVGTQMHTATNVDRTGITAMLQKMADTGKMVRISEIDIKANDNGEAQMLAQADLFRFVIEQYCTIVPKEQWGGITFWGVSDKDSWLGATTYPLLFDEDFNRKLSFESIYLYLRNLAGLDPAEDEDTQE